MGLLGFALLALAIVVAAALIARREPSQAPALEALGQGLGQLQAELVRVGRRQEELRIDVHRGREASLKEIAEAAQGIRGEIGQAQLALAEVKALEQGRAQQMDAAANSLRRLEAVVAGPGTRGAAGENILARAFAQLPPDLVESNVAFGSKVVEYALRLPGGRYLPIDSKWTSAASLERLADAEEPQERRRLVEQVARDLRGRIREMSKYLDPERTLSLALLAVPDAVYSAAPEVLGDGYREGVLVVPYSLALPYVLALYRLTVRFASGVDTDQLATRMRALDESLRKIDEEVEGRFSRSLVQLENSREALRDHVGEAQRTCGRLLRTTEEESPSPVSADVPQRSLTLT